MRILVAFAFALFVTSAVAENLVLNKAEIKYKYSFETQGSLHFCDLSTWMLEAPMMIKLTAAFITDDAKPKNKNVTVAYMVEAYVVGPGKNGQLENHELKVVAGRIISDIFHSDLQATKNNDRDLGASYTIPDEASLASFGNVVTMPHEYTLVVEFEKNASLIVNVKPTPEQLTEGMKWNKCSIASMEHRSPK
jgi:hypothetical protein